jgi:hypothetical protein
MEPLDRILASWMTPDTLASIYPFLSANSPKGRMTADNKAEPAAMIPVTAAFPFKVKEPSVSADLVVDMLDAYARDRDENRGTVPAEGETGKPEARDRILFLGSRPRISGVGKRAVIRWHWRLGEHALSAGAVTDKIAVLLRQASQGNGISAMEFYKEFAAILGAAEAQKAWRILREGGLAVFAYSP